MDVNAPSSWTMDYEITCDNGVLCNDYLTLTKVNNLNWKLVFSPPTQDAFTTHLNDLLINTPNQANEPYELTYTLTMKAKKGRNSQ